MLLTQCAAVKFVKKLRGEREIETVLQRLDRLTQDEARMTVAQTLSVVHGLMGNVKVAMEGTQLIYDISQIFVKVCLPLDGKVSTDSIRDNLGMCLTSCEGFGLVLTSGCSHNSPNVIQSKQSSTFVVPFSTFRRRDRRYLYR